MSEPVTVFASFRPLADQLDAFLALMQGMIDNTRQEPGCELYDFYRDGDGGYHLFERYVDGAALDAHRDAPYYKDYRARVVDMIDGPIGVVVLSKVDRA